MNKTIIITGIPGTGKTTVCNTVEKLARQVGKKVDVITYGTVMVEIFQKCKEMNRDAMWKADIAFQRKLQGETAEAVKEEMLFSRLMAGACAVLTGVPMKIVINAEGKQEEAAKGILKALGQI